jgi:uncharacterized protein YggE
MNDIHSGSHTQHNRMILSGTGQVSAVPNEVIIRLGVQTNGTPLQTIQAENAQITQAVLQALRQLGVTDIKTYQYDINKVLEYEDGRQIDRGYSVQNILEIRSDRPDLAGTIIDTAVNYGANRVDLIRLEVSDADSYYLEALNLAVANAYDKADTLAESLGARLQPYPLKIQENSTSPIPYQRISMGEGAFATPIVAGTNQIEASVTVEFGY